jgi:hypothetical protein
MFARRKWRLHAMLSLVHPEMKASIRGRDCSRCSRLFISRVALSHACKVLTRHGAREEKTTSRNRPSSRMQPCVRSLTIADSRDGSSTAEERNADITFQHRR